MDDKLLRAKLAVNTYDALVKYWSDKGRIICSSFKLDQSREFIDTRLEVCRAGLAEWQARVSELEDAK